MHAATVPPGLTTRFISPTPRSASLMKLDDELRERPVERLVVERELLGGPDTNVHAGQLRAADLDERLGRVDRRDVLRAGDGRERAGETARSAAHVEEPPPGLEPAASISAAERDGA